MSKIIRIVTLYIIITHDSIGSCRKVFSNNIKTCGDFYASANFLGNDAVDFCEFV